MNISSLVWREILHRKLGFAVGLVSVVIAVTGLTGALVMLQAHDIRTERIIEIKEGELREEMIRLEDDYRRIMRRWVTTS